MILGHSELPPLEFKRGDGFGYIHAEMLLRPGVFDIYHPPIFHLPPSICRALAERGEQLLIAEEWEALAALVEISECGGYIGRGYDAV